MNGAGREGKFGRYFLSAALVIMVLAVLYQAGAWIWPRFISPPEGRKKVPVSELPKTAEEWRKLLAKLHQDGELKAALYNAQIVARDLGVNLQAAMGKWAQQRALEPETLTPDQREAAIADAFLDRWSRGLAESPVGGEAPVAPEDRALEYVNLDIDEVNARKTVDEARAAEQRFAKTPPEKAALRERVTQAEKELAYILQRKAGKQAGAAPEGGLLDPKR
jgi:hypothetical protein